MQSFLGNTTRMQNYVSWVRDIIKTALDGSATGDDFAVSTIFTWAGASSSTGYAFIVEQRDGAGAATGNQWMFVLPYRTTTYLPKSYFFQSHATYLKAWGQNATTDSNTSFYVWFFPAGGLRRSQVTLTGGHTIDAGDIGSVVSSGSKAGVIEGVSTNVVTIRHTAGAKWAASDSLTVTGSGNYGTITTEDWRSFPNIPWLNFSALTLASGDFTALVHPTEANPYASITDFLPKEGTGAPFRNYQGRGTHAGQAADIYALAQLVFDNDAGFCAAYCSNGQQYEFPREIFISGDILQNANESTTWIKGACGWQLGANPLNGFYTEQYYHESEYYGGGAGTAGVHASFTERLHENFTVWNHVLPTTPQTFAESRVYLYDANEAKGWINPDVVRIQGAANHCQGLVTSRDGVGQNLCIKKHDQMMLPWVDDLVFGDPNYTLDTHWPPLHLWI
jgi:hypothetical protein